MPNQSGSQLSIPLANSQPERSETFDSLDHRIEVFLNRWQWRGSREIVKRELEALIASQKAL
jgi:hypothetical protein